MKKIYKYTLGTGRSEFDMPKGAVVLAAQDQLGRGCLWALVDPHAPTEKRLFDAFGTGHDIDEANRKYIGTYQTIGQFGVFVWHVFEVLQ